MNSKKNIIIISTNTEIYPDPVFPLGPAYIAGVLKDKYEITGIDLCFSNNSQIEKVIKIINDKNPIIVGISIRNIDNTIWPDTKFYLPEVKQLVKNIKNNFPKTKITLGGSGFSIVPQEMILYTGADFGICGEGEESFPKLIEAVKNKTNISSIPGLVTSQYINKPKKIDNLNLIPMPSREIFDWNNYMKVKIAGNIQTKRGCAFECTYCTYPLLEGKKYRFRNPLNIIDEIKQLKQMGVRHIQITDSVFTFPPEFVASICNLIIEQKVHINWNCYGSPVGLSKQLLQLMKKAGCKGIEFGIDSTNDNILKINKKGFTQQDIINVSNWCKQERINYSFSLIMGLPGETKKTLNESIDIIQKLQPDMVYFQLGVRIYPNTEVELISKKQKIIKSDDNLLYPVYYISPEIKDSILDWAQNKLSYYNNFIVPAINKIGNQEKMKFLKDRGVEGPLWPYLKLNK